MSAFSESSNASMAGKCREPASGSLLCAGASSERYGGRNMGGVRCGPGARFYFTLPAAERAAAAAT